MSPGTLYDVLRECTATTSLEPFSPHVMLQPGETVMVIDTFDLTREHHYKVFHVLCSAGTFFIRFIDFGQARQFLTRHYASE